MKTQIAPRLKKALLASMSILALCLTCSPSLAAADHVSIRNSSDLYNLFNGMYKGYTAELALFINSASFDPSNSLNGDYTIDADILITEGWNVKGLPQGTTFTFNGALDGLGSMYHYPAENPSSTYIFKGDMSTFSGGIYDSSDQLKVVFDRADDSEINMGKIVAKEIQFTNSGNYSINNRYDFVTKLLTIDKDATANFNDMNLSQVSSINNKGVIRTSYITTTLNDDLEGSGSFEFTSKGITLNTSQSSNISNELKFAGGSNTMSSANSSDAISLASLTGAEAGTLLTLSTGSYTLNEATLSQIAVSMGADSTLSVSGKNTLTSGSSLTATGALSFMLDTTAENSLTSTLIVEAGASLDLTAVTGINLMLTGELAEGFSFNLFKWQNDADVQGLAELLTIEDGILINGETLGELGLYTVIDHDNNTFSIIPEPSTATLSLLALAGLLARRRRKAA